MNCPKCQGTGIVDNVFFHRCEVLAEDPGGCHEAPDAPAPLNCLLCSVAYRDLWELCCQGDQVPCPYCDDGQIPDK